MALVDRVLDERGLPQRTGWRASGSFMGREPVARDVVPACRPLPFACRRRGLDRRTATSCDRLGRRSGGSSQSALVRLADLTKEGQDEVARMTADELDGDP